jgi:histidine ammonia-lyase
VHLEPDKQAGRADRSRRSGRTVAGVIVAFAVAAFAMPAAAQFKPINPTMAGQTVTLNGQNLTIEALVQIARGGAKLAIAPEAMARAKASYGLMLQAQEEGVAVYRFNRGAGSGREIETLKGSPDTPENLAIIARRFEGAGPGGGGGSIETDVTDEDDLRAMLVTLANQATWEAASENYINGTLALLNNGIYPAFKARGGRGEADFIPAGATMMGRGFAYYKGQRIPAADALRQAGLQPFQLSGNDDAMNTVSSLTAGKAALYVHDLHEYLQWADTAYVMTMLGLNSNVTPIVMPVQGTRPFPWVNYHAARVMEMIRGSYLFDNDPARIIQDPEGLRAFPWRQGAVWEAWANLRDNTLIQMNSSDHNPTSRPGVKPEDAWELATPQMMKYHIKGGRFSNNVGGYIFSNSNWDPFPLVVSIEQVAIALTNVDSIIIETMSRFNDPYFTVVRSQDIMGPGFGQGGGGNNHWLWSEILSLATPLVPPGIGTIANPADVGAVPLLRLERAERMLDVQYELLAGQIVQGAYWMDVRKRQTPAREFGTAPTAIHAAIRQVVPLQRPAGSPPPTGSNQDLVMNFIKNTPVSRYYRSTTAIMPRAPAAPMPAATLRAAGRTQ